MSYDSSYLMFDIEKIKVENTHVLAFKWPSPLKMNIEVGEEIKILKKKEKIASKLLGTLNKPWLVGLN